MSIFEIIRIKRSFPVYRTRQQRLSFIQHFYFREFLQFKNSLVKIASLHIVNASQKEEEDSKNGIKKKIGNKTIDYFTILF
jgi:hypothetical protein